MLSIPAPWQVLNGAEAAVNRILTLPVLKKALGEKPVESYVPRNAFLYVAASCLPYHISGYTARTQEILEACQNAGMACSAITRPGYPQDRPDALHAATGDHTAVNYINYGHIPSPSKNSLLFSYVLRGAKKIRQEAARIKAALIHAASNHVNALPALLAARQLGIPFQYEMRGLWELSRASRQPEYANSYAFKMGLNLEKFVAQEADRLFVISHALKDYVIDNWGLDPEKIELLPNCVNGDRFVPSAILEQDTLCYAGSLVEYEGLDVLLRAGAILRDRGKSIKIKIIGDGEAGAQLHKLASDLNLPVDFHGRVPPEEARASLAKAGLVCIPRKPYEVCRLITPLKLVEAMAMAKPVIVPDLPVFRDEAGDGAYFFEAGNEQDLANKIQDLIENPESARNHGLRLRSWCLANRTWDKFVPSIFPRGASS